MNDPREPMTIEEVEELLGATLHGPLPQTTVYRMMTTLAEWRQLPAQLEAIRVALDAYPDSNLGSLAKLYHDFYTFRMARCDSGDCETLEMYRRNQGAIHTNESQPVCLGCGKTYADCKCTDEQIEYHKRLEREEKAE